MLNGASLFGNGTRTSTLLVISMLGETHAAEVARVLGKSKPNQGAVDSLELAGLIVGAEEGRARQMRLNPRYAAADELRSLLTTLACWTPTSESDSAPNVADPDGPANRFEHRTGHGAARIRVHRQLGA